MVRRWRCVVSSLRIGTAAAALAATPATGACGGVPVRWLLCGVVRPALVLATLAVGIRPGRGIELQRRPDQSGQGHGFVPGQCISLTLCAGGEGWRATGAVAHRLSGRRRDGRSALQPHALRLL